MDEAKKKELWQLERAISGFIDGLDSLTAKQKTENPTEGFGRKHNDLLREAKRLLPDVSPTLWPEEVKFNKPYLGAIECTSARYVELNSYARMMLGHVKGDDLLSPSFG